MHDVAQLSFDADVVFFFETISDPIKTYDYSSPDEPIAQVAESTLTLKRGPESYAVRTSRIRRADDTDQPREP